MFQCLIPWKIKSSKGRSIWKIQAASWKGNWCAIIGDSVDNIPGVPGIGIKTAALLINEYGNLDGLFKNAESIKQKKRRENIIEFEEQAYLSKKLVTLRDDVPLPIPIQ